MTGLMKSPERSRVGRLAGCGTIPRIKRIFHWRSINPVTQQINDDSANVAETQQDPHSDRNADPHADKYNDPRAQITRRGVLMGVAVVLVGAVVAGLSIYARKTPLVETTKFWGPETVTALQLAERIELFPRGNNEFPRVELTTTPGLGHLRRALLDERNFDWNTIEPTSVASKLPSTNTSGVEGSPSSVQLRLTDPTAHRVETIEIDIDLNGGWVGPSNGAQRVKIRKYVQPKLKNYFKTVVNFKEKRYDDRD